MEGDAELQDLYRETLLDYYESQSHKGKLLPNDFYSHGINPVCGDEIEVTMKTGPRNKIEKIRYEGHGCVISQASSAIMVESLEGKTLERARQIIAAFKNMLLCESSPDPLPEELEAAKALEGVKRFPARIKCATLAWNTLSQGLSAGVKSGKRAEFEEAE